MAITLNRIQKIILKIKHGPKFRAKITKLFEENIREIFLDLDVNKLYFLVHKEHEL